MTFHSSAGKSWDGGLWGTWWSIEWFLPRKITVVQSPVWGARHSLWQKDRENQECDEPLDRKASKPCRACKVIDDQARKCWTESGTDTHYRTEHSLGKVEASSTFRYIGDHHCRDYTEHGPGDNV